MRGRKQRKPKGPMVELIVACLVIMLCAICGVWLNIWYHYFHVSRSAWDDQGNYLIQPQGFWYEVGVGAMWGALLGVLYIIVRTAQKLLGRN